jgi:hypothetical protein
MKNKAIELVLYTKQQLMSAVFKIAHKTAVQHFTRQSPLNFQNTALAILRMIKKSIKVELMSSFEDLDKELEVPSRQAFSQARDKLSYLAFKDFFEKSCELALDSDDARTYKGFRLFAIDGTSFIVGALQKLRGYFGESTTVRNQAMCRISGVVDVLNEIIVSALVSPFSTGERALAINQVLALKSVFNALYLFDRGYWSPKLISAITSNGQKFVMRLAANTGKTVVMNEEGSKLDLRQYSFILPSGTVETLLTNFSVDEMSDGELAFLYSLRWGIETKYLELKERLQVSQFSSESVNSVLQDIYSTLYISNLAAFICFEADEAIKEKIAGKDNKYDQKSNRSVCIAALRDRFIQICISDPDRSAAALQKLYKDISKEVTYINKSKSRPRNKNGFKSSKSKKSFL